MLLLCVVLIGMLEFGLRWIYPIDTGTSFEYRIPHPYFGWVLMPGASYLNRLVEEPVPVSYNADGWRDFVRAEDKAEGVVRVLVLGDSFMEAYSVRFEDSLPARVEHLSADETADAELATTGADQDLTVHRSWRHGFAVTEFGIGDVGLPHEAARPGVERDELRVDRAHEYLVSVDGDAPVVRAAAIGPDRAHLVPVVPILLTCLGIERIDMIVRCGDIHHAIDNNRCRLQ